MEGGQGNSLELSHSNSFVAIPLHCLSLPSIISVDFRGNCRKKVGGGREGRNDIFEARAVAVGCSRVLSFIFACAKTLLTFECNDEAVNAVGTARGAAGD